jgi:hypothetical protein
LPCRLRGWAGPLRGHSGDLELHTAASGWKPSWGNDRRLWELEGACWGPQVPHTHLPLLRWGHQRPLLSLLSLLLEHDHELSTPLMALELIQMPSCLHQNTALCCLRPWDKALLSFLKGWVTSACSPAFTIASSCHLRNPTFSLASFPVLFI